MRSVPWKSRIAALAIVVVLLVPAASASNASSVARVGLWDEFIAWLAGRIGIPPGNGDQDGFTVWLAGRIEIPNG